MSNKGEKLTSRLAEFVSKQSEKPSKKELESAIKTVFKDMRNQEKTSNEKPVEKTKRQPSGYNIFYAEQSAILKKKEDEEGGEKTTAQSKMKYIAALWKERNSKNVDPELEDE